MDAKHFFSVATKRLNDLSDEEFLEILYEVGLEECPLKNEYKQSVYKVDGLNSDERRNKYGTKVVVEERHLVNAINNFEDDSQIQEENRKFENKNVNYNWLDSNCNFAELEVA